jgi:SAM-dependent methyltransferase
MSDRWTHETYVPLEFWDEVASLPGLRPVLDYADEGGAKNDVIDRLHRRGLEHGLRSLPQIRYRTAVDFGCGIGRMTTRLTAFADAVVGVDPTAPMLERARRASQDPRVRFLPPDALDAIDGPVLVVSVYVLYALPPAEVVNALRGLRTVASSSGAGLVAIERMERAPGVAPRGIEARNVDWYAAALRDAGWALRGSRKVRRSDSIPLRIHRLGTRRLPDRMHRALSAAAARLEWASARRATHGDYVDVAFWAS